MFELHAKIMFLCVSHGNANGVGVNGEGVKTIKAIKAIKTIKTIQTPKKCMRTRKRSNSYRKTIGKLQFNDLRRIPKKKGAAAERRRTLFLSITLYSLNCSFSIVFQQLFDSFLVRMHVFCLCIVFIVFIAFIVLTPSPLTPTPLAFLNMVPTVNFVLKQRSFNCLRNYLLLWHRVTVATLLEWAHELVKFSKSQKAQ